LSEKTGCRILAKCEHLNPGGSVKDRAAFYIINDAERRGYLNSKSVICEGSGGNTGIALAMLAAAKGYKCFIAVPEVASKEKVALMEKYGATIQVCPMVPFTHSDHYF
jgi:cysteine synthase A